MSRHLEPEEHQMPLMEHLRELRRRLIISAIAMFLGMAVGMAVARPAYAWLTAPIRLLLDGGASHPTVDTWYLWLTGPIRSILPAQLTDVKVHGTLAITSSPMEGVYTWLRVSLLTGALLASPVIAHQGWQFVAPGLYRTERRVVLPLAISSALLFLLGAGFAYVVLLPVTFPFFLQVLQAEALLSIDGYLRAVVRMLLAFGLCFQLPVAVFFLARMGFVDHRDMLKGFRYAIVGMFFVSALLTPPDVLTQVLLGIPMVLLYGVSIGVAWLWTTKGTEED